MIEETVEQTHESIATLDDYFLFLSGVRQYEHLLVLPTHLGIHGHRKVKYCQQQQCWWQKEAAQVVAVGLSELFCSPSLHLETRHQNLLPTAKKHVEDLRMLNRLEPRLKYMPGSQRCSPQGVLPEYVLAPCRARRPQPPASGCALAAGTVSRRAFGAPQPRG